LERFLWATSGGVAAEVGEMEATEETQNPSQTLFDCSVAEK
jgi:hypothetical protein